MCMHWQSKMIYGILKYKEKTNLSSIKWLKQSTERSKIHTQLP